MSLYLVEGLLSKGLTKGDLERLVSNISQEVLHNNGSLVEVQLANDMSRGFFITHGVSQELVKAIFSKRQIAISLIKSVRLIGQELEEVQKNAASVGYVVEWNLPEEMTMETYLLRKKQNSVHYEKVPEVKFQRTYVCEDMTKCVCFYDAPDSEAVQAARDAVSAPIDVITEVLR